MAHIPAGRGDHACDVCGKAGRGSARAPCAVCGTPVCLACRWGIRPALSTEMPRPVEPSPEQAHQASELGLPPWLLDRETGVVLALVPGCTFWMGATPEDDEPSNSELPCHKVKIRPFYLAATPVTQGQWVWVMGTRPWTRQKGVPDGPRFPAVCVSWFDAAEFVGKLNRAGGRAFRLPSEAEWEGACRAGSASKYFFGNEAARLGDHAWYAQNARAGGRPQAREAGGRLPNQWGLYDMLGNVWEWCRDHWHDCFSRAPDDGRAWEDGKSIARVCRGGAWSNPPRYLRSASRIGHDPDERAAHIGFRVAWDPAATCEAHG